MPMRSQLSDEFAGGDAGEPAKRLFWSRVLAGIENRVVCAGEITIADHDTEQAIELLTKHDWLIVEKAMVEQQTDLHTTVVESRSVSANEAEAEAEPEPEPEPHITTGTQVLCRLEIKRIVSGALSSDIDQYCHDQIVVAFGHEGMRIYSLVLERRPPRAIALKRQTLDAESMVIDPEEDDVELEGLITRLSRTTIYAPRNREKQVWEDYRQRQGLPQIGIHAEQGTLSKARLIKSIMGSIVLLSSFAL